MGGCACKNGEGREPPYVSPNQTNKSTPAPATKMVLVASSAHPSPAGTLRSDAGGNQHEFEFIKYRGNEAHSGTNTMNSQYTHRSKIGVGSSMGSPSPGSTLSRGSFAVSSRRGSPANIQPLHADPPLAHPQQNQGTGRKISAISRAGEDSTSRVLSTFSTFKSGSGESVQRIGPSSSDKYLVEQTYSFPADSRRRSHSLSSKDEPDPRPSGTRLAPATMPRSPNKPSFMAHLEARLQKSSSFRSNSSRSNLTANHIQPQPQHYPERKSPLPPDFPNAGNNSSFKPLIGDNVSSSSPLPSPNQSLSLEGSESRFFARGKRLIYVATDQWQVPGDLNVAKYEKLELINKQEDTKWFMKSKVTGSKGLVPKDILTLVVDLDNREWFHGLITREEAEKRLLKAGKHGTFLIRYSVSNQKDYALSLLDGDLIRHYRIREHDTGGYFIGIGARTFVTVDALVEHYGQQMELCARLVVPCYKAPVRVIPEDPRWELNRSTLELGRELGKGQFGVVREATLKVADPNYPSAYHLKQVAVKELKKGKGNMTDFLSEVTALKKLEHERLLRLVGVCTDREPWLMVTEYMKNGSLLQYLKSAQGRHLRKEELLYIALQVAEGMYYLEEQRYVHRDLAARNVLLDHCLNVKIADFGLSKLVTTTENASGDNPRLPVKWSAIEALLDHTFTSKSDVWSFGVLLFEIMTFGLTPYREMNNYEVLEYVKEGKRMKQEPTIDDRCYNIMLECWSKRPENRPTFYELRRKITDHIKEVKITIQDIAFDQNFIEK